MYLIAALLVLGAPSVRAELNMREFVNEYLKGDPALSRVKADLAAARAQADLDSDLYQMRLSLTPSHFRREFDYPNLNSSFDQKGYEITGEIRQTTPLGLELYLKGTKFSFETQLANGSQLNGSQAFGLTLPIYRNSFGYGLRRLRDRSDLAYEAAKASVEARTLTSCSEGGELFINAWALENKVKLLDESLKESQRALKIAQQTFNRRLSRKMDWLSAQADFLRVQDLLADVKARWSEARSRVAFFQPFSLSLKDPTSYILGPLDTEAKIKSADLRSVAKLTESASAAVDAAKSSQKSGIDLFVESGQINADDLSAGARTPYNERYLKAGLQISLPLISKTPSAVVAQSLAEQSRAGAALEEVRRQLHIEMQSFKERLAALTLRVEHLQKRVNLRRDQVKEGFRLMETGRIEFEDYVRMRDLQLNELLEGFDLKLNLWQVKASWAKITGQSRYICAGEGP